MKSKCAAAMVVTMVLASMPAHAASLVSWWMGQDNANDVVGSNHGTLGSGAGFAPGRYGQGFSLNGVAGYVSVPHSPSLRPGTNSFSLAAWIKTTNRIGWRNIIAQYEGSGSSFGLGYYGGAVVDGKLRFDLRDTDRGGDPGPDVGGGQKLVGTHDVADGVFHHVAFVCDVEHGEMRIYLDGALEASAPLNAGATGTIQDDDGEDDPVIIGAYRDTYLTTMTGIFDGIIDEVQYYAGAIPCSNCPPSIITQPASLTTSVGASASFNVAASGTAPLNYEWRFNGTNIPGATSATLALTNVQFTDAGAYLVIVTNVFGSVTSAVAQLTMAIPDSLAFWARRDSGSTNDLYGIAYGQGLFVVAGHAGSILTSADGVTWTSRASGTSKDFHGLTYANSLFVAVGESGRIITSPDGMAWIRPVSGTNKFLEEVTYGNDLFVAVGSSGTIQTSPDGVAWTVQSSGTVEGLNGVAFANGTFVAVGDGTISNAVILISTNGTTWNSASSDTGKNLRRVTYGQGIFVAIGNDDTILTSPDGASWTNVSPYPCLGVEENLRGITYTDGSFVVVGNNGTILISPDGVVWTCETSGTGHNLHSVAYGHGRFVAVGTDGTLVEDDTTSLSITQGTVREGNTGTTNAVFALHLDRVQALPVSVDFATADGGAVADADYIATSGTVTFAPGETEKIITVVVSGDVVDETNETFFVRFSNFSDPLNVALTSAQAIGTILDDDTVPLSITGATVFEGHSGTTNAVFALHLDRPHVLPVSVDFATANGSAVAGADYIATSGVVTFAPGETDKSITVLVIGDLLHEADKTFFVNLNYPIHATLVATQASGTILNDDTVQFYVNVNNPNPVPPYANWATAAVTIQDAIDRAETSDEIVVTNGVYATGGRVVFGTTNRVTVTKRLTVRSVHGPTVTVIQGHLPTLALSGSDGVRCAYLTNGAVLTGFTLTNGAGGVRCASPGSVVANCIITGNSALDGGGGAAGGTLNNCLLTRNSTYFFSCECGGGNDDLWHAGTVGGAVGATLNNCTLIGNSGSGAFDCALNNCIVYYDTTYGCTLNYCCATLLPPAGLGNFTNAPLFEKQASGNLRLQFNSPCINAGNNAYAPAGLDLDGNARIAGGTVDVGAYEFQSPQSLISYAWLQQHSLPINPSTDSADLDGDRLNNFQEWRAGTDPTNALSTLRLLAPNQVGSNLVVRWVSVPGRLYFLERSTNLTSGANFSPLVGNLSGQAGSTTYTDTNAVADNGQQYFYRVGVE